jgi:hypothetical protein
VYCKPSSQSYYIGKEMESHSHYKKGLVHGFSLKLCLAGWWLAVGSYSLITIFGG